MRLKDLKPAWKQLQVSNDMQQLDALEILALIDQQENSQKLRLQRVFAQVFVFVVITILCQGG